MTISFHMPRVYTTKRKKLYVNNIHDPSNEKAAEDKSYFDVYMYVIACLRVGDFSLQNADEKQSRAVFHQCACQQDAMLE